MPRPLSELKIQELKTEQLSCYVYERVISHLHFELKAPVTKKAVTTHITIKRTMLLKVT